MILPAMETKELSVIEWIKERLVGMLGKVYEDVYLHVVLSTPSPRYSDTGVCPSGCFPLLLNTSLVRNMPYYDFSLCRSVIRMLSVSDTPSFNLTVCHHFNNYHPLLITHFRQRLMIDLSSI
jgi:hypothetical protein